MNSPNCWFDACKAGPPEPDVGLHGDNLTIEGMRARSAGIGGGVQ